MSLIKLSAYVYSDKKQSGQRFVHLTADVEDFEYNGIKYDKFAYCQAESNGPFRYYTPEYFEEMLEKPEDNMDKLFMYSEDKVCGRIMCIIKEPELRERIVNILRKLIVDYEIDGEYGVQEF